MDEYKRKFELKLKMKGEEWLFLLGGRGTTRMMRFFLSGGSFYGETGWLVMVR